MMYRLTLITLSVGFLIISSRVSADSFSNDIYSSWADTPNGRFECLEDKAKDRNYLLKYAGKVVYRGSLMRATEPGDSLKKGIRNENVGCPWVIASRSGYVIFSRDVKPPSYGIEGYAVIDFNSDGYPVTELAEAQRPGNEKLPDTKRIKWSADGFELTYFGYPIDLPGGSQDSPKPRMHIVRYDFKSRDVMQKR